jgi:hypothetical protein
VSYRFRQPINYVAKAEKVITDFFSSPEHQKLKRQESVLGGSFNVKRYYERWKNQREKSFFELFSFREHSCSKIPGNIDSKQ